MAKNSKPSKQDVKNETVESANVESVESANVELTLEQQLQQLTAESEKLKSDRVNIDLTSDEAFNDYVTAVKSNENELKRVTALIDIERKKQQQHEAYLARIAPINEAIDNLLNAHDDEDVKNCRQALVDMIAPKTATRSRSTGMGTRSTGPTKTQQILDIIAPMYEGGSTPTQVREFFRTSGVVDNTGQPFVDGTYNAVIKAYERDVLKISE